MKTRESQWLYDFAVIIMGGLGSGNWYRTVNAKLIDDHRRVEVSQIIGTSGRLPIEGCDSSEWSYLCDKSGVLLLPPDEAKMCGGWIRFVFTECNFGGRRRWLVCPLCKHRRGGIYLSDNHAPACRECLDLRYASRYGSHIERILHRARRLERKLFIAHKAGRLTVDMVRTATQLEILRTQVLSQLAKAEQG